MLTGMTSTDAGDTTHETGTGRDDVHQVRIVSHGTGATFEVNGHDIAPLITGYTINHDAGNIARVTIKAADRQPLSYEGPSLIDLIAPVPADRDQSATAPALVADWLAQVDPADLERQALDRCSQEGMGTSPIAAALTVLIETARAATSA
jgi:hypothetical protein